MPALPTHLVKTGAVYKFRARIPQDLQPLYGGKKEVMESLQTKYLEEAKRLLPAIELKWQQEWEGLAERARMSRRSFTRQFKLLTGTSFLPWLLAEHLAYVQRLLESTDAPVERVAERAGFGSPESLRLHFRRQFGISPTQRRKLFRE